MARPRVGDVRREEILAAFEACVLRNGIERTTLEDIAREAGQPRSLVRYFAGNRDALTALLIDRLVARATARLAAAQEGAEGSVAGHVEALFGPFYDDEHGNRLIVELWHMSLRSEEVRAKLASVYGEVLRLVAEALGRARPGLGPEEAADTTYATYALGLGAAVLAGLGVPPERPDRLLAIARGIAAGDVPAPSPPPRGRRDHR